jgi:secretion/DNA translocation related CpaE-like protein
MNHPMARSARPLVCTEDELILDPLLRLAAAAGVQVELAGDAGAVRAQWTGPPLIVIGADQADRLASARLQRRPGVVLVGTDGNDPALWRRAVALGAERVALLPDDEAWLVDELADVAEGTRRHAVVVGVVGGRGGAGASVLAAALAMSAVPRGLTTMLVDADPLGGGLDLVLGAEDVSGLRWPDLAMTRGRVGGGMLRGHLPDRQGLSVLSWDRGDVLAVPAEAVNAVIGAASRAWDLVVIDLPRTRDEAVEEALGRCTSTLLVVPAEVRAVAAAARVAASLAPVAADLQAVVRGPAPSHLRATDVADALGLPLAAELEPEPGLSQALERGEPPGRSGRGPLAATCADLLDDLVRAA